MAEQQSALGVPYPVLDWLVKVLHQIYSTQDNNDNNKLIFHDIVVVLEKYMNASGTPHINNLKIKTKIHTSNTGVSQLLICLHGVFREVPFLIYVPKEYPLKSPFVTLDYDSSVIITSGNGKNNVVQKIINTLLDKDSGMFPLDLFVNWEYYYMSSPNSNDNGRENCKLIRIVENLEETIDRVYTELESTRLTPPPPSPPPVPKRPDMSSEAQQPAPPALPPIPDRVLIQKTVIKENPESNASSPSSVILQEKPIDIPDFMDMDISGNRKNELDKEIDSTSTSKRVQSKDDDKIVLISNTINTLGNQDLKKMETTYRDKLKEIEQVYKDFTNVYQYQFDTINKQEVQLNNFIDEFKQKQMEINALEQKCDSIETLLRGNVDAIEKSDSRGSDTRWEKKCIEITYDHCYEKQIIELRSRDRSYDDCIYLLGKKISISSSATATTAAAAAAAASNDTRNSLSYFKKIRELARQQFMTRYEMNKLREMASSLGTQE